jgi:amino acid permease
LADLFGGRADMWSYGFFLLLGLLVVMGINVIKYVESFFTILILGLFVVLLVFAAPEFAWTNVPVGTINTSNLLMIYGVALTACFGLTAVPQVRNILRTEKPTLTYAAILVGGLVPAGLYILFSILTLGVTGTETSPVAIVSLTDRLGFVGLAVGSLFAVLAMTTSFLALGLALRNVLHHDYGFSKFIAFSITLGVPLSLFIFGIRDFVGVLSVIGGVALNIVGIISILLFWRANQGEFTHRWQRMVVSFFSVLMFCMFVVSLVLVLGGEG